MTQDPFDLCEALVRKVDYDRYLSALFAPTERRRHLFALYAFNHEVAKTAESVTQPIMGQMRLQWWCDALDEIEAARERHHELVEALAETLRTYALPRAMLNALIDAHEADLIEAPFDTWAQFDNYADATAGNVIRLAARILGGADELDTVARHAGVAYALTGLLRALPFHAAKRRLMLPMEALSATGISQEQVFSGTMDENVAALIALSAVRAREYFNAARKATVRRDHLPALLPASLVPLYLKRLTRRDFNPFRDTTDVPIYRRQLAMLTATLRGNL
jgi:phytoene/squalene synthetase